MSRSVAAEFFERHLNGNINCHSNNHVSVMPSSSSTPYEDICPRVVTIRMVNTVTNGILGVGYEARVPRPE
jgi:hypothetical protein